jgi:hypothetical protein
MIVSELNGKYRIVDVSRNELVILAESLIYLHENTKNPKHKRVFGYVESMFDAIGMALYGERYEPG